MIDAATLLTRLRSQPKHLDGLVTLLLDDFLSRPMRSFLDPERMAPALAQALRETVSSPGFPAWLQAQIEASRTRLFPTEQPLREALPPELPALLHKLFTRPYVPDRALVSALLDNDGMRSMLRTILQNTLSEFADKLWSSLPSAKKLPGGRLGSKLMGVAKGVASAVGGEVEKHLDDRVNQFVDGTLDKTLGLVIDRICNPNIAQDTAWKGELLQALLDQPFSRFYTETEKLNAADTVADLHAILKAFVHWEKFEGELLRIMKLWTEERNDQDVRSFLEGSGIEESWRAFVHDEIKRYCQPFLESEGFATWLETLCAPEAKDDANDA